MGKAELAKCTAQNEQLRTTCAPTAMLSRRITAGEKVQAKRYADQRVGTWRNCLSTSLWCSYEAGVMSNTERM